MDLVNDIARLVLVLYGLYVGSRVVRAIDAQEDHHRMQARQLNNIFDAVCNDTTRIYSARADGWDRERRTWESHRPE